MYYRRLRDLREDHEYSQARLARKMCTSQSVYSAYERGRREIPFSLVIYLAKLYNVSIDFIAELTDEPRPLENSNIYGK